MTEPSNPQISALHQMVMVVTGQWEDALTHVAALTFQLRDAQAELETLKSPKKSADVVELHPEPEQDEFGPAQKTGEL